MSSSTVPDISPPSICPTKILLSEPTIAPANASGRSPCTIIKSGFSCFMKCEKPSMVLARVRSIVVSEV